MTACANNRLRGLAAWFCGALLGAASSVACAETPAWLPRPAADLDQFGRLFLRPEQRAWIDEQRRHIGTLSQRLTFEPLSGEPILPPTDTATPAAQPTQVTLSGVLYRADGQHMVWIDGRSALSNEKPTVHTDLRRLRPTQPKVRISLDTQQAELRPGQVWLVDEQQVAEAYRVQPAAPAAPAESPTDAATDPPAAQVPSP